MQSLCSVLSIDSALNDHFWFHWKLKKLDLTDFIATETIPGTVVICHDYR